MNAKLTHELCFEKNNKAAVKENGNRQTELQRTRSNQSTARLSWMFRATGNQSSSRSSGNIRFSSSLSIIDASLQLIISIYLCLCCFPFGITRSRQPFYFCRRNNLGIGIGNVITGIEVPHIIVSGRLVYA